MPTVHTYLSLMHARQAADFLLSRAIIARVVPEHDPFNGQGVFAVVTVDDERARTARELLREFEGTDRPDSDWESRLRPDLARLPPETKAQCTWCGHDLQLDESIRACPSCAREIDIVEILVARHGPDILAPCYDDEPADIPEEFLNTSDLACPACNYTLRGLASIGICPECGSPYSKADILRRGGG